MDKRFKAAKFQSTLPARGATVDRSSSYPDVMLFQSTLPARGATRIHDFWIFPCHISIHAPCTGSDNPPNVGNPGGINFNPRSLHGERRWLYGCVALRVVISIHAPCTGSDPAANASCTSFLKISIHAPCTGSDGRCRYHSFRHTHFNPRSLHGERPAAAGVTMAVEADFNPRSLHGERPCGQTLGYTPRDFNPRSLHGERLRPFVDGVRRILISIHAPCTGSDRVCRIRERVRHISIHAPCTGSDRQGRVVPSPKNHFNPRSLHGERRDVHTYTSFASRFQSTLPARGATCKESATAEAIRISIHAPCTGSDTIFFVIRFDLRNFNPRSLHGERPMSRHMRFTAVLISIHAPCTGSDFRLFIPDGHPEISIHAPCTGSDTRPT